MEETARSTVDVVTDDAGEAQVSCVEEIYVAAVVAVSNLQDSELESTKLKPETVTMVFPSVPPELGEMDVGEGVEEKVKRVWSVVKSIALAETSRLTAEVEEDAGLGQDISVDEMKVEAVGARSPNWHVMGSAKLDPVTVTSEPPVVGPLVGKIDVMEGSRRYEKMVAEESKSTPLLETVTPTSFAVLDAGVMHVISVDEMKPAAMEIVPNLQERSAEKTKSEPVMVTRVPPSSDPKAGVSESIAREGVYVKESSAV